MLKVNNLKLVEYGDKVRLCVCNDSGLTLECGYILEFKKKDGKISARKVYGANPNYVEVNNLDDCQIVVHDTP
jgi:hypothetical protein